MQLSQDNIDLLYLIRLSLTNNYDENYQIKTPMKVLFNKAQEHYIEALLYSSAFILSKDTPEDTEVLKEWSLSKDKAFRKHILFQTQRERIFKLLGENHIWYVPLKGLFLQKYYPEEFMRQMKDNDILFDGSKKEKVKEIMLNEGFRSVIFDGLYDDIYHKDPIYNFEMHYNLNVQKEFKKFFSNINDRLIVNSNSFEKELTYFDQYIYLLSHDLKHFKDNGIGVRSLIDFYFLIKNNEPIDVTNVLKKTSFLNYDEERIKIIEHLFSKDINKFYSILDNELLYIYCNSGVHGNASIKVYNGLKVNNNSKVFYLIKRLIPNLELIYKNYPKAKKYKILLPFCMVHRILKSIFSKHVWKEVHYFIKYKK